MDIARQPWPEALAGAVMGTLGIIGLAFTPAARLIEQGATAPFVLLAGAIAGAVLSWWAASRRMRTIVRAEETVAERPHGARRHAA